MLKLGTFKDEITAVEYDLYQMNAQTLREHLDKSYQLTDLKLQLFNFEARVISSLESASRSHRGDTLAVDYKTGVLVHESAEGTLEDTLRFSTVDGETQALHSLGYELMPLAISLPNKDIALLDDVELLDGFRRMFYMKAIPDRDIFVRVYDTLNDAQWLRSMLMFNSWKIKGRNLIVDKGFLLGLYKHYGIDITQYGDTVLHELLEYYFNKEHLLLMLNGSATISDINAVFDFALQHIIPPKAKGHKESFHEVHNLVTWFKHFLDMVKRLRRLEKHHGLTPCTFAVDEITEMLKADKKKYAKVIAFQVTGHTENYVAKEFVLPVVNMFRAKHNLTPFKTIEDITFATPGYFHASISYNQTLLLLEQDEVNRLKAEYLEREEARKNRPIEY